MEKARAEADFSEVTTIGVDETSRRRGHNYITVFMDLAETQSRVRATYLKSVFQDLFVYDNADIVADPERWARYGGWWMNDRPAV